MCCTRLAENTGRKNGQKFAIWAPSHNFVGLFAAKARIDNRKKLLNSNFYTYSTYPHNTANFGPLTAEVGSGVWDTPANFNGFRILEALLHGHQPNFVALNRGRHLCLARHAHILAAAIFQSLCI